ncbi:MAG TPA: cache domain-containing protein [Xanthobacteraceae bacterium]|nr:cache domain-containing protein [Xanthobacteraceae bacterium]
MLRTAMVLALALFVATPIQAAEFGTRDEAVAMVKRVQERFKEQGAEATFKAVTDKDPAFQDRDLYPFIYTLEGQNVAHGANPALVGKNLLGLKDQGGKLLIREIIDVAKEPGSGWVDYKWPNPVTQKIDEKSSYVERMGDYVVGVGVYR